MSPEGFIHNLYGPKTDVWAFGVMVYELLHGETPYSRCRSEEELKAALRKQLTRSQLSHEISSPLKDLILRCMEVNESTRVSVEELA